MEIRVVNSSDLFVSGKRHIFPQKLFLLKDSRPYEADVDVVISTLGDTRHIVALIENYLSLEKGLRVHVWVVVVSLNVLRFLNVPQHPQVSKILILNNPTEFFRFLKNKMAGSSSAALGAQLGQFFGSAPYFFYSHEDMMATKKDFLSFLRSKMDERTPLASFSQRHIIPFSGGMLMRKDYFQSDKVDWLPLTENNFNIPKLASFTQKISPVNWVDTGEQFIYRALEKGDNVYVCESKGKTEDYAGDPLDGAGVSRAEVKESGLSIQYANAVFNKELFTKKHPELSSALVAGWRKSFDDAGDMIFIHRGRGTTQRLSGQRGDFAGYLSKFNAQMHGR